MTAFKRGPHGRLVFAKCVLPSVNKVYYYYYYYFIIIINLCYDEVPEMFYCQGRKQKVTKAVSFLEMSDCVTGLCALTF